MQLEKEVYEALVTHFRPLADESGGWETELGMLLDERLTRLAQILCEKAPDVAAFTAAVVS